MGRQTENGQTHTDIYRDGQTEGHKHVKTDLWTGSTWTDGM